MSNHFAILIVVVPLIAAPLCVLFRHLIASWLLCLGVLGFAFMGSIALLGVTLNGEVIHYALGGWLPPIGIAYKITAANASLASLISFTALIIAIFVKHSVQRELKTSRPEIFFSLYLLCVSGLLGLVVSNDLFNIFIFLEIASLSGYALVAFNRGGQASLAAFRYLLIGSLGATFFLIGVGYLYALTGSLNLDDIAQRLPEHISLRTTIAAFVFISIGLMLKIALFPLHMWQPDVYAYAPSSVSALFAAASTKAAVYVLIRLFFDVFGIDFETVIPMDKLLMVLASVAILFGAIVAIGQTNIKRMMAYSSVGQIGYVVLGVSLVSTAGMSAAFLHMYNHALIKGGLFLALGCLVCSTGATQIKQLAGLGKRMPWTAAALVVGGLSLIGVPLTSGFISKWYLVEALLNEGLWQLVFVVLLGSGLAAVYVWRIVEALYLQPADEEAKCEADPMLLLPTWVLIGTNLYFGVHASGIVQVAQASAKAILE